MAMAVAGKESLKRVGTGILGLDELLKGGLPAGRNILVSGCCGTGKTTLAIQFIYEGIRQFIEPGVFVTLEESKERIYENMLNYGWDLGELEKNNYLRVVGGPLGTLSGYTDKFNAGIGDLVGQIADAVGDIGAKRLAVDSLDLLTMLFPTEAERRTELVRFCNTIGKIGCTCLLTSEVKENTTDLSGYGIAEYVVDGVIVLYLQRMTSSFVQGIGVRKMRGVDHVKEVKAYEITSEGIRVYPNIPMITGKGAQKQQSL
jgi:KaiC/GvpD/RAD55 family RecA-like ATPase